MDETKKLAEFSEEELNEDPLLFLGCGHVFPMSTLDGLLDLSKSYTRDDTGAWDAPLEVQQQVHIREIHQSSRLLEAASGVNAYMIPRLAKRGYKPYVASSTPFSIKVCV
jgi:hypothetical protein